MATKGQHDNKERVKPNLFDLRSLEEAQRKKPLSKGSSSYKNQRDELARLSKVNPPPPPSKANEKGKEVGQREGEESVDRPLKRKLTISKNIGPPPPPKRQTALGESLKRPMVVEPIYSILVVEGDEVREEGVLLQRKKKKVADLSIPSDDKAQKFLRGRTDEIASAVLEMLSV